MGAERGSRHKRSSSFAGQSQLASFVPVSTDDDRTSLLVESSSKGSPLVKPRNALTGPHDVGKRHVATSEHGSASPPVETSRQGTEPIPRGALQDRLLPTVVRHRQHFRPEESPEDVCTLEELNPSMVTLVPDFGFMSTKGGKEKGKKKSGKQGPSDPKETASTDTNAAVASAPAAARGRSPSPLGRATRPDPTLSGGKKATLLDMRPTEGGTHAGGEGSLARPDGDAPVEEQARTSAASLAGGRQIVGEDTPTTEPANGRKAGARPKSSLGPREFKLQPLPFQNVFGMSVDEMLDIAPVSREQQPTTSKSRLNSNRSQGGRLAETALPGRRGSPSTAEASSACGLVAETRRTEAPEKQSPSPALAGIPLDKVTGDRSPKPLSALKNPALRALTLEDRTTTFGSGKFVVEDFLANLE